MPTPTWFLPVAGLGIAIATCSGCTAGIQTQGTVEQRLQAEDPAVRIVALKDAVRQNDTHAAPLIIDRLSDSESDVRFFAGIALTKLTGEDFGWRAWDPPQQRQEAQNRWRQWAREQYGLAANHESTSGESSTGKGFGDGAPEKPSSGPEETP